MANTITHQGIVENIDGFHLRVRIVQTSACVSCSVKGHCSTADSKEKVIDVTDLSGRIYEMGQAVVIVGTMSMGMKAVALAFVVPFLLVIVSLFLFMTLMSNELIASILSLAMLMPYYFILWMNKARLKQQFSFTIKPIKELI